VDQFIPSRKQRTFPMTNENKLALVTGGASGIGYATAIALASEGMQVVICGRNKSSLKEAANSIGTNVIAKVCDVANHEEVEQLFAWLTQEHRSPDILVNCAGINIANRMMANIDPVDFDRVMRVNVTGTFNCIHAALPEMRKRGDGYIINVVSVAGKRAMLMAGMPYCVYK